MTVLRCYTLPPRKDWTCDFCDELTTHYMEGVSYCRAHAAVKALSLIEDKEFITVEIADEPSVPHQSSGE